MPDDNFMDDEPEAPAPPQAESAPDKGAQEDEGGDEGETVLANKTIYPDAKPGDSFMVKVVRVHDDELELMRDDDAKEGGAEDGAGMAAPPTGDPDMASMME